MLSCPRGYCVLLAQVEWAAAAAQQHEAWEKGRLEAEGRWRGQLDGLKGRWVAERTAIDEEWAHKLEAAHAQWLQVRAVYAGLHVDAV